MSTNGATYAAVQALKSPHRRCKEGQGLGAVAVEMLSRIVSIQALWEDRHIVKAEGSDIDQERIQSIDDLWVEECVALPQELPIDLLIVASADIGLEQSARPLG